MVAYNLDVFLVQATDLKKYKCFLKIHKPQSWRPETFQISGQEKNTRTTMIWEKKRNYCMCTMKPQLIKYNNIIITSM